MDRGSGVAHYDLEVRIEEGAWQPVLTHTTATRHRFPLPPGSYFAFRLTASDNVGNVATTEAQPSLARVTKYYYSGGRRVAQRRDGVVYYLHGDHLSSVSLVTDGSGAPTFLPLQRDLTFRYGHF